MDFLKEVAKKIISYENKLKQLLKIQNPILCDLNCESIEDMNFMGMQKTKNIDLNIKTNDYYIAKSLEDLKNYDKIKPILFDIPINRNNQNWNEIISLLKEVDTVYLRSLTNHLAILFREFRIKVEKAQRKEDYEIIVLER